MAQTGRHWLEKLAGLTEPDLFICNSRFTASLLPRTRARVETIFYPVLAPPSRDALRRANPHLPHLVRPVVVQVSRMESWKGHQTTLEALGRLRDLPDWSCLQVGGAQRPSEQRYLDSLRETCTRLGIADRVHFAGHRSDVGSLLAAADIFCQPNLEPEPFGISFVEALYAGLPVISSAIGGAVEIVDADCGALVPAGDAAALAGVLSRLITDRSERERLGRAGPARARACCDPHTQMNRIAAALERVAAGRSVVH
jgi:glycosyltransferase involved in cell wall biosynthesis